MAHRVEYQLTAQDKTKAAIASAKRGFGSLDNTISKMRGGLVGIAGAAGIAGIARAITQTVKSIDALGKQAKSINVTSEALQELQQVAGHAGVETSAFNGAMEALNRRMGELKNETGSLYGYLKKADEALVQQLQDAKSLEEAFGILSDRIKSEADQTQRAALIKAAFSTSAKNMVNMLGQGSKAIDDQRQQLRDLGTIIRNDTVVSAEEMADTLQDLENVSRTASAEIAVALAPAMITIYELAAEAARGYAFLFEQMRKVFMGPTLTEKLEEDLALVDQQLLGTTQLLLDLRKYDLPEKFKAERRKKLEADVNRLLKEQYEIRKKLGAFNSINVAGSPGFGERRTPPKRTKKNDPDSPEKKKDEFCKASKEIKKCMGEAERTAQQVGQTFADSFTDAILQAKTFEDVLRDLGAAILRLAAQKLIADQIASGLNTLVGAAFNPKPAAGGAAAAAPTKAAARGGFLGAGQLALVGEKGPELFVAGRSGSIVAPGTGMTQQITVNAQGATPEMIPRLRQAVTEAAQAGYAMVLNDLQRGGAIRRTI